MFKLWCEWDVGQEHKVFTSEEAAWNWFNNNIYVKEMFENDIGGGPLENRDYTPFDYYDNAGLVGIEEVMVI